MDYNIQPLQQVQLNTLSKRQITDMTDHYQHKLPCLFPPEVAIHLHESHPIQPGNHEFSDFLPLEEYTVPPVQISFINKVVKLYPCHWRHNGIIL